MTTKIINNGITDVTVVCADIEHNKALVRIGYEDELLGAEIFLGYSYYIGNVLQDPPHLDTIEEFTEVDAPEGYYDDYELDDYEEPSLSDIDALLIITG